MYDATDESSLRALAEVNSALLEYGVRLFKRAVLVANKADLAEEAGHLVEPGGMAEALGVEGFNVASTIRDPREAAGHNR